MNILALFLQLSKFVVALLEWQQMKELKKAGADELSLRNAQTRAERVRATLEALGRARDDYARLGRVPDDWRGWRD